MTLDEAIEYYIDVATQRAIADEEMGVNDNSKWNETIFMTKKKSKQMIADNLQLVEWLKELKKAKRLLKVAVEDFSEMKPYLSEPYSHLCDKWRYADEALKLIGDELSGV